MARVLAMGGCAASHGVVVIANPIKAAVICRLYFKGVDLTKVSAG